MEHLRELTVEEHKKIALDILVKFAEFCEENGLRYGLAYGTLLGAIRHNGFIPWDDDIDVQMPRPDYEKLKESFNQNRKWDNIKLISPYDEASVHTFIKIINTDTVKIEDDTNYSNGYLGVDIDVFPVDGEPDTVKAFESYFKLKKRIYGIIRRFFVGKEGRTVFKRILINCYLFLLKKILRIDKNRLMKIIDKINNKYKFDSSQYVGTTAHWFNSTKNRFKRNCYENYTETKFEGYLLKVPTAYDEILSAIYGNYMELPPLEKRVTHHLNKIYIKEG